MCGCVPLLRLGERGRGLRDEDGAVRFAEDPIGDAALQEAVSEGLAARAEDDEVGPHRVGAGEDLISDVPAFGHDRADLAPRAKCHRGVFEHLVRGVRLRTLDRLVDAGRP